MYTLRCISPDLVKYNAQLFSGGDFSRRAGIAFYVRRVYNKQIRQTFGKGIEFGQTGI